MKHPPYQLRPNKAIDRMLLLSVIERLQQDRDLSQYTYFGFGGPFLSDIRLVSQYFPTLRFVSIEEDEDTHKRQKFHCPTKRLRLIHSSLFSYLQEDFASDALAIFWLDYTDFSPSRLEEFGQVLDLLGCPSIVKVTVRAQFDHSLLAAAHHLLNEEDAAKLRKATVEEWQTQFGDYLPGPLEREDLERPRFAPIVQSMFQVVAQKTLPSAGGKVFQLVHSCRYADGPQMLSLTGVVCEAGHRAKVRADFAKWPHANLDWRGPDHIDVPNLSIKERLALEKHLPVRVRSGKALQRSLGYLIDKSQTASERKLRQYKDYYQFYPVFAKVRV